MKNFNILLAVFGKRIPFDCFFYLFIFESPVLRAIYTQEQALTCMCGCTHMIALYTHVHIRISKLRRNASILVCGETAVHAIQAVNGNLCWLAACTGIGHDSLWLPPHLHHGQAEYAVTKDFKA